MTAQLIQSSKTIQTLSTKSIALIAGEGKLPTYLAKSAKEKGYTVIAFALSPEAKDAILPHCDRVHLIAPGQLGRNLKLIQQEELKEAVFIGKVPKINLLRNLHKLDWTAIKELGKLPNLNDDTIQCGIGNFIESMGIKVLTQREFLHHLFPNIGVLTKQQPNAAEYADITFGLKVAKEIARLDIGQTVVVKNQMILAIEAIEGTDQSIKRAVDLAKGPVVVVKVSKQNHDPRFDIPTVGMSTLNSMLPPNNSGGVLAIEANETLVVDREEMIAFADNHKIAIVAVADGKEMPQ